MKILKTQAQTFTTTGLKEPVRVAGDAIVVLNGTPVGSNGQVGNEFAVERQITEGGPWHEVSIAGDYVCNWNRRTGTYSFAYECGVSYAVRLNITKLAFSQIIMEVLPVSNRQFRELA